MKNKKYLNFLIPILYLIICLIISFNRIPFWDEARAWLISQNANPIEILDLMKLECHMFIWYLIIFPFAKLNLFYPYSIFIINSLISFFAILALWNKSPFSTIEKIMITFGVPFLFLWGSVARCYSIGILFIFLALSFYKERFNYPIKYILLLSLALNTSVMSFIGAFFLSIIFLFENLKNKSFKKTLLVFILGILIVLFQIYSPNPDYLKQNPEMGFLRDFIGFIFNPVVYISEYKIQSILISLLRIVIIFSSIFFIYFTFKNNKKVLAFTLFSFISMIILFTFFYSGNFWHYFYFYLYFIVAIWILKIENKLSKPLTICFFMILFLFLFKGSLFIDSKLSTINNSNSKAIAKEIINNSFYKDKKIFCLDPWSDIVPTSLPYLSDFKIYDKYNQNRKSTKSMRSQINFNNEFLNPDDFSKYIDENSIIITDGTFLKLESKNPHFILEPDKIKIKGKNNEIVLLPIKSKNFQSFLIKVNKLY